MAKQTSVAINKVRTFALEKGIITEDSQKKSIDGDRDRGYVFAKILEAPAVRLVEFHQTTNLWVVCGGATALEWDFDFAALATVVSQTTLGR